MKSNIFNRTSSNRGFTMVELLVAVMVLSIGLMAMAGVVPMAMRTITTNRILTKAVDYSQQEMETLKRMGFDNLALVNDDHFNPSGNTRYESWVTVTSTTGGAISATDKIRMVRVTTSMKPGTDEADLEPDDVITMISYFTR
ncbi:MAG: prepilin-type N-terminal cleavage/methylation domain-containing protein [bacterium]|nr:prepilin-type N-terminal cleavage/methylation domain-containing protein [bacterium]